jgi:hypothetical protein
MGIDRDNIIPHNIKKLNELKSLLESMKTTEDLTPVATFTLTKFVDQLIEENEKIINPN